LQENTDGNFLDGPGGWVCSFLVITLAKKELINLPVAIAVMLGAELETCSDKLMAAIRSEPQGRQNGFVPLII